MKKNVNSFFSSVAHLDVSFFGCFLILFVAQNVRLPEKNARNRGGREKNAWAKQRHLYHSLWHGERSRFLPLQELSFSFACTWKQAFTIYSEIVAAAARAPISSLRSIGNGNSDSVRVSRERIFFVFFKHYDFHCIKHAIEMQTVGRSFADEIVSFLRREFVSPYYCSLS